MHFAIDRVSNEYSGLAEAQAMHSEGGDSAGETEWSQILEGLRR